MSRSPDGDAGGRTVTAGGPGAIGRDVVLRDGTTVVLRVAHVDDIPAVEAFYGRLSEASLHQRFGRVQQPSPSDVHDTCQGTVQRQALLAVRDNAVVAVAEYRGIPAAPSRGEVAFAVVDDLQGLGIGTWLLDELAEAARARGVVAFDAEVQTSNHQMLRVFVDSGFAVIAEPSSGVTRVALSLDDDVTHAARAARRSAAAAVASMRAFFEPRSVAVIGVNRERGRIGSEIYANLAERFTGHLYAVSPQLAATPGRPVYASVAEIPQAIDLAVVVVPAAQVESVVDACLAKDVRALVVISAGFSETGADGSARETALLDKVRAAGARMVGPNCMGVLNTDPAVQLNATFAPSFPPAGVVALSSQSGALGLAILDFARRLNLGISTFVSVGNKADVSSNDLLQYWADDPRTSVILLYLESFGNPRMFGRLARRVGRDKPIVAVKSGRSTAGARAAQSHTGAMASSNAVTDALFQQSGVIRTDTLEEMFDVATLLAHQPVPAGPRLAILTNAGGPGILAADACEARGLAVSELSDDTRRALGAILPAAASVRNPVDMLATASAADYRAVIPCLLADPGVDSLLVIFIPPLVTEATDVASAIVEATRGAHKPVVATFLTAQGVPPQLAPVPCFVFPESAVRALAHAARYGAWRREAPGRTPAFTDTRPEEARRVLAQAQGLEVIVG